MNFNGSPGARVLADELSLYPEAGTDEPTDLVVNYTENTDAAAGLVNPKTHEDSAHGFTAHYSGASVRFSFDDGALREVDFALERDARGLRRIIRLWRNIQFQSRSESVGQIFHELALVPSMYFDRQRVPVHAASVVAPSGGVTMIGGTGGVGKTSLELELCREHGYRFVADDVAILSADGSVWPNLAFPKIYGYNVVGEPELEADVLRGRSAADRFQWRWRKRRAPAKIRRRMSPARLYGDYSREGEPLSRYIVLAREHRDDFLVTEMSADRAADVSVHVMTAEYGTFHNHIAWHEYNRGLQGRSVNTRLHSVLSRWRELAAGALAGAECVLVRAPIDVDHTEFCNRVARVVRSLDE